MLDIVEFLRALKVHFLTSKKRSLPLVRDNVPINGESTSPARLMVNDGKSRRRGFFLLATFDESRGTHPENGGIRPSFVLQDLHPAIATCVSLSQCTCDDGVRETM